MWVLQTNRPGIFNIDSLTQNALKIFDWKEQIRTALITYGNYASIMVLIHLTWKLIINNRNYQNQEERCDMENRNQVISLLLSEFRNHLIQDIPLRQPEH